MKRIGIVATSATQLGNNLLNGAEAIKAITGTQVADPTRLRHHRMDAPLTSLKDS